MNGMGFCFGASLEACIRSREIKCTLRSWKGLALRPALNFVLMTHAYI